MTVALTESKISFRLVPKVPASERMSAASQVDWRSSHIRTGSPLQIWIVFASFRLFWALALGAVHVQRQTDDDELCLNIFCRFADLGRHFRAAFFRDLGRDGGSQKFGDIAGGKAGAAVPVIHG